MTRFTLTAVAAALAFAATTAGAGHNYDYVKKGCDHFTCFQPYKPYKAGHYSRLKCADPYDRVTFVERRKWFLGKKHHALACVKIGG